MSGSGGGGGVSHLGIALVIIFAISLLAIFTQLFYVLWRRLSFRRRTSAAGGGDQVSRYSSSESSFTAPSKELLYFFCIRPQFCLDRSSLTPNSGVDERNANHEADAEVIDIDFDLLKIQGVFGPPRFLFTIKEEKEETESPAKTMPYPAENEMQKIVGDDEKKGSESLEECYRSAEDTVAVEVEIMDDCSVDDDDATPFSTPCASPVYFTPTASPVHAAVNGRSAGVATMLLV